MKKMIVTGLALTMWAHFPVFSAGNYNEGAASGQPNILLIIADDLTFHDIEPYGGTQARTPHIARLANEGVCFDNMFTATAMCAPTRQQLYTGIYPVRNGAFPNHGQVYPGVKSVAHHLQALGYQTALIGKQHFGPAESFPFEILGGKNHDNGKGKDVDLSKAEEFVRSTGNNPYFLIFTSNQPHGPLNRGDASAYPPEKIKVPPYLVDTRQTRTSLSNYFAEITYLDSLVGKCLDIVERSGEKENTIVIFTTEQGSGMPFCKWTNYDNGLKTGFIVRWPGKIKAGSRVEAMTQYVDVVPTLIELAGGEPGKIEVGVTDANGKTGFDGRSFKEVLTGEAVHFRDYVYGVHTTRGIIQGSDCYPIRSVRSNQYLYIQNLDHNAEFSNVVTGGALLRSWQNTGRPNDAARAVFYINRPAEELYDVKRDPYQLHNLIGDAALKPVVDALKKELAAFMKQQGDTGVGTEMNALDRQVKNNED